MKKRNILAILMTMVMVLSLVATNGVVANAASKKLKVTVKTKTVEVNKTITLKTNVKSNFKSSNEKIATVNKKGVVKGKKAGKVKITVTSKANKTQKKIVKITVIKPKKKPEKTTEATTTEATTEATTTEATTEVTTTEDVVKPVEKPTTEAPAPQKPTSEEPKPENPTSEEPTSEEPTSEEPTSEEPTSEEPKPEEKTVVGIEAEYKVDPVPNDIYLIGVKGLILKKVYSDGTKEIVPINLEVDEDLVFYYSRTQTIDGTNYGIWNVKYLGFSTEMKVEMVNVGDTVYSYNMIAEYTGSPIKEGETISVDDISATILNTDKSEYVLDDNSELNVFLYEDLAKTTGTKEYCFGVSYDYSFEDSNGNEVWVIIKDSLYVPYE